MRLKPVYYGKIWDAFDMELQKGEEQNNYPRTPSVSSTRSNSPLLVPKRENHYDPVSEEILREKFRNGGVCTFVFIVFVITLLTCSFVY